MAVITPLDKTAAAAAQRQQQQPRRTVRPLVLGGLALSAGAAVWAVVAALGLVENLPTPAAVVRKAGTMIADGTLASDTFASLRRVFIGYALGVVVAVPVGFLMGWYPVVRAVVEPYIQFFRTIPPLALIPLAVVLLGIGEVPKIAVIALASFMACAVASFQGVVDVDRTLINAARVLGAPDRVIFAKVVVPASTPFILVGMRIGLGASWATVVAAELIGAQEGLGYRMQKAATWFDMDAIFVSLITIGVLGLVMDPAIDTIKKKVPDLVEVASTKDNGDSFPTAFVAGNKVPEDKNSKVVKVLQQANDWRQEHPEETIALTAKLLEVSEAQTKADASHVQTLSTADLVAKTKSGEVDKWLKTLGDFFVRNKQLDENPDPGEYYAGELYEKAQGQ